MANEKRLEGVVGNGLRKGRLTPASTQAAVEQVYRQVCRWERVPAKDFQKEIMRMWWGQYDIPPAEWPDAYLPEERHLAAELGINPANLGGALWLRHEGLWDHWVAIVEDRDPASSFHFCDLGFFVRAARQLGAERVMHYRRAKTWTQTRRLVEHVGCEVDDGLALHAVLKEYSWRPEDWSAVIDRAGGRRVAAVLRYIPSATPHAAWVALRVPEARKSEYFLEMAPYIGPEWDAIPERAIRRILRETPWQNVMPNYRVRLIEGGAPRALAALLWEPLDGPTAHRWLTETGGHVTPDVFYAVQEVGLPAAAYERLVGYREKAEKIVIDWYARKRTSPKMTRERPWTLPDGTRITIPLMAVLDEVRPEHLINGIETDPDRVFMAIMTGNRRGPVTNRRSTGNRVMEMLQEAEWRSRPFPEWPERTPVQGITQIRSWDWLVAIGNREGHCAGEYVRRCAEGTAYMFEVDLDGRCSLFHITATGALVQHLAKANTTPVESHQRAVAEWLRHNGAPNTET